MATLFTYGLSEIQFGGTKVGMTYKDTAKMTQDDPEVTEFYEEGKAQPAVSSDTKKIPKLEFAIMNPDAQFLQTHLGGTYDSITKTWSFDGSESVAEGEWTVLPKKGFKSIKINKGKANAKIDFDISDKGILLVRFVITPLTPDDETKKPIEISETV